jgi:integrase
VPRASRTGIRGLYRDGDGRYRIDLRYDDPAGIERRYKEVIPPGTPAAAAKARATEVLTRALSGTLATDEAEPLTLRQAFDRYLVWVETNRPKAYKQRTSIAKLWIEAVGNPRMTDFGASTLEKYKAERAGSAPATINKAIRTVRHMAGLSARKVIACGIDRDRAAELREVPLLREPPGRQRPIRPVELTKLLGAFKRVDARFARRVMQATLLTGCRLGEILDLRQDEADLRRGVLDLTRTKQNRNHQIPVSPPLAALVREALADKPRKPGVDVVFTNSRGLPYTVDGFSKHWAKVAERAGCGDITFHDLRRHVGTLLINQGERLEVVSKLLGHSTIAVTQRSYAHLATDAVKASVASLAKFAPALPPAKRTRAPNRQKTRRSNDGATP